VNKKYFLIRSDNWGSKIHIIWPLKLQQDGLDNLLNENLPIKDTYATWCTESITGDIRQPTEYDMTQLNKHICENCMKKAINDKHNPTPKFIKHINKSTA